MLNSKYLNTDFKRIRSCNQENSCDNVNHNLTVPVSYTHLDVYKRQSYTSAAQFKAFE